MSFAFFMKWILVLALLVTGAIFLVGGLGVEIPIVKYKGLEAQGVPAGIGFLVVGVALAAFWKVKTTRIEEDRRLDISSDGSSTSTVKRTETRNSFRPPGA